MRSISAAALQKSTAKSGERSNLVLSHGRRGGSERAPRNLRTTVRIFRRPGRSRLRQVLPGGIPLMSTSRAISKSGQYDASSLAAFSGSFLQTQCLRIVAYKALFNTLYEIDPEGAGLDCKDLIGLYELLLS